jgi:transcriptional regulator with XRE-family HTH domain
MDRGGAAYQLLARRYEELGRRRFTPTGLAHDLGMDPNWVRSLFKGYDRYRGEIPDAATLKRIAEFCDVPQGSLTAALLKDSGRELDYAASLELAAGVLLREADLSRSGRARNGSAGPGPARPSRARRSR